MILQEEEGWVKSQYQETGACGLWGGGHSGVHGEGDNGGVSKQHGGEEVWGCLNFPTIGGANELGSNPLKMDLGEYIVERSRRDVQPGIACHDDASFSFFLNLGRSVNL